VEKLINYWKYEVCLEAGVKQSTTDINFLLGTYYIVSNELNGFCEGKFGGYVIDEQKRIIGQVIIEN
jgi:hypothetical protein